MAKFKNFATAFIRRQTKAGPAHAKRAPAPTPTQGRTRAPAVKPVVRSIIKQRGLTGGPAPARQVSRPSTPRPSTPRPSPIASRVLGGGGGLRGRKF